MSEGWSLTESDPAIFTALLSDLGVSGLEVSELYALDAALLASLQPIYALIFLFKYVDTSSNQVADDASTGAPKEDTSFYFAHQVINNACATLALLNAVMNIPEVKLGSDLDTLKEFSLALDPSSRGWALGESEKIREAHNSFARSDPFEHTRDPDDDREKEDAYHFIAYCPINGELYELDGLKRTPITHGPIGEDWLKRAQIVVEARIASYGGSEINFNLMAICADQLQSLKDKIATSTSEAETYDLQARLAEEQAKRERWAFDNSLRRHNHLGLVHALLVELGRAGQLRPAIEESRKAMKERQEKAKERAKMAGEA